MSSLSMATAPPLAWPEPVRTSDATISNVIASGAKPRYNILVVIEKPPPVSTEQ
jgi:hypothetical protein